MDEMVETINPNETTSFLTPDKFVNDRETEMKAKEHDRSIHYVGNLYPQNTEDTIREAVLSALARTR